MNYDLMSAIWGAECNSTEKLVLCCLAFHAKPGGGNAYPSQRRIKALTGIKSKSTIERTIATLIGRGYVRITRRGGQNAANTYKIEIGALLDHALTGVPGLVGFRVDDPAPIIGAHASESVPRSSGHAPRSPLTSAPTIGAEQTTTPLSYDREHPSLETVDASQRWHANALPYLRQRINAQSFDTWLRPARAAGYDDATKTFWLALPSPAFATVADRYQEHLVNATHTPEHPVREVKATCTPSVVSGESSPESQPFAHQQPRAMLSPQYASSSRPRGERFRRL